MANLRAMKCIGRVCLRLRLLNDSLLFVFPLGSDSTKARLPFIANVAMLLGRALPRGRGQPHWPLKKAFMA
jgi:hypothetical protein